MVEISDKEKNKLKAHIKKLESKVAELKKAQERLKEYVRTDPFVL